MAALFFITMATSILSLANYENGKDYCQRIASVRVSEVDGSYLTVPYDYSDSTKGTTQIYYHFAKKFNPNLPTLIFFSGGPGGASHYQGWKNWDVISGLDINVIHFDQRGIACSRPDLESSYKDVSFYSSENTAKDADEIRKTLNISKVTVYGHSYGTAPATIYASLFSAATRSLILEGVAYSGFDFEQQTDKFRIKTIQKYFDSLPVQVRERWIRLVDQRKASEIWFPYMITELMSRGGLMAVPGFIQNFITTLGLQEDDAVLTALGIKKQTSVIVTKGESGPNGSLAPAVLPVDNNVNAILFCKEFGASVAGSILILKSGQVQPMMAGTQVYNSYASAQCPEVGLAKAGPSTFIAKNYPVSAPVYYMQGTLDAATPPRGSVYHYKNVPQNKAYLLFFKKFGHGPSSIALVMGAYNDESPFKEYSAVALSLFQKAINAEPWTKENVSGLNKYDYKVAFTSKEKN